MTTLLTCDHVHDGELLERYLAGELEDAAGDRVEAHYFACPACFERLQILRAVREEFPRERRWNRPAMAAVAAGLIVAAAGATWVVTLRRENRDLERRLARAAVPAPSDTHVQEIAALRERLSELSRPELNAAIVDLEPDPQVRRGDASRPAIDVPGDAPRVTFVLTAGAALGSPPYSVSLLDANGRTVWEAAGLRKSPFDTFTLSVPVASLSAGPATLRVRSASGGAPQDYRFRVVRR